MRIVRLELNDLHYIVIRVYIVKPDAERYEPLYIFTQRLYRSAPGSELLFLSLQNEVFDRVSRKSFPK